MLLLLLVCANNNETRAGIADVADTPQEALLFIDACDSVCIPPFATTLAARLRSSSEEIDRIILLGYGGASIY